MYFFHFIVKIDELKNIDDSVTIEKNIVDDISLKDEFIDASVKDITFINDKVKQDVPDNVNIDKITGSDDKDVIEYDVNVPLC